MVCVWEVVPLEKTRSPLAPARWSPVSGITLGRREEVGLAPPGRSGRMVCCLLQHPPAAVLRDALWDALCSPSSLSEGSPMVGACLPHPGHSVWVSLSLSPLFWYPCHSNPSPSPRTFQYIPPKVTGLGKQGPSPLSAQAPPPPVCRTCPGPRHHA